MGKGMWGGGHWERTEGTGMRRQGSGGNCGKRDVGRGTRGEGKGVWR